MRVGFLLIWIVLGSISCQSGAESETQGGENINIVQEPANISYQILKIYPHDTSSFTQGLEYMCIGCEPLMITSPTRGITTH